MAEKVTFDGPAKAINVVAGVSELDVEGEVYSAWKRWSTESDNAKYLQAFRTFGGDPTSAGQYAPKYFFLLNGWQIHIDGNDTLYVDVALNLYVDGGGNPFILTNGATVSNLRSDVAVVESEIANVLAYDGILVYDEIDGVSGSTYPTGTRFQPVNNLPDLKLLQNELDITNVLLRSDMTCVTGVTFSDTKFESNTASYYVTFAGVYQGFNDCYFDTLRVQGDLSHSSVVFKDCGIFNVDNVIGIADNCHLMGNILIASGGNLNTSHCVSGIPGNDSPSIDMNPGYPTTLSVRAYSGGLKLYNCDTTGDTATVEYVAGKCKILSGCTDGFISVRGIALVTDESSGATVDTSALYETANQYQGEVVFDSTDGYPGDAYPIGTSFRPVDNFPDLIDITRKYNIHNVLLESNATLSGDCRSFYFKPSAGIVYVDVGGALLHNCQFEQMLLYGDWGNAYPTALLNCFLNDSVDFNGVMKDCIMQGTYLGIGERLGGVYETSLVDCAAGDAGATLTVDLGTGYTSQVNIKRYAGNLNFTNMVESGDTVSIVGDGGKITIDPTCTAGTMSIAGQILVEDNSNGTTVITEGLFNASDAYNGTVNYSENAWSNSSSGTSYPVGSTKEPVNNWSDAVTIMEKYHLHNIALHSNTSLTESLTAKTFSSVAGVVQVDINGQDVNSSTFDGLYIYGDFAHSYQTVLRGCFTNTIVNFNGVMQDCALEGDIGLSPVAEASLVDCVAGNASGFITFDKVAGTGTSLNVKRYAGGVVLINSDHVDDKTALVMDAGRITLDSSCTAGSIALAGDAQLIDNSVGATVNSTSLIDPYVQKTMLSEILGLNQSNFAMTNQTYTVSGSLETAIIKTYPTAAELNLDTNEIAEYAVAATYDGNGLLNSYKVTKT